MGSIGEVDLQPSTRVRLVELGNAVHRIELVSGAIQARIWAPPGQFFVDTAAGVAVDLGCAYDLAIDERGRGLLTVSSGWVGFDHQGLESFVPAGGACTIHPGRGPGTPYYTDSPAELREALVKLDFDSDPRVRASALTALLRAARPRDALTLWHLLGRSPAHERPAVFDRMAALLPPPSGVSRRDIVRGDRNAIDRWWGQLGVGPVEHWRRWKAVRP